MVDHFFEIPRLVVFGVKCLNGDFKKICLRDNPAWKKDDTEVIIKFPCLLGRSVTCTLCAILNDCSVLTF